MATINELSSKVLELEEKVNKLRVSNSVLRDEIQVLKANADTLITELNVRFDDLRESVANFRG